MNTDYRTPGTIELLNNYLKTAYNEYTDAYNNFPYYVSESRALVCENCGLHEDGDGYELLVLNGLWTGKYTFDKGEFIRDWEDEPDDEPNDWLVKTREEIGEQRHNLIDKGKTKALEFDERKALHLESLLPDNYFDIGF